MSTTKASRVAEFRAEFLYDQEDDKAIHMITVLQMRWIVYGSLQLGTVALGGTMYFDLLVWEGEVVLKSDMFYVDELLSVLRTDSLMVPFVNPCRVFTISS